MTGERERESHTTKYSNASILFQMRNMEHDFPNNGTLGDHVHTSRHYDEGADKMDSSLVLVADFSAVYRLLYISESHVKY